ncbi:hypothetical protein JMUB6875_02910 [Nocardia sp. JMUB6875]
MNGRVVATITPCQGLFADVVVVSDIRVSIRSEVPGESAPAACHHVMCDIALKVSDGVMPGQPLA